MGGKQKGHLGVEVLKNDKHTEINTQVCAVWAIIAEATVK